MEKCKKRNIKHCTKSKLCAGKKLKIAQNIMGVRYIIVYVV